MTEAKRKAMKQLAEEICESLVEIHEAAVAEREAIAKMHDDEGRSLNGRAMELNREHRYELAQDRERLAGLHFSWAEKIRARGKQ